MAAQIAESIRSLPQGDPILIFGFKGDDNMMMSRLQRAVSDEGIDIDEMAGKLPRFGWLTWGNETSHSRYSHCKHIVLAGVLRRSPLDLVAAAAGREDDLCYRLSRSELDDVRLSETAHCVLQAMNRGSCRCVDGEGRAAVMTLTVLADVKGLGEALADSLPGVDWQVEKLARSGSRTAAASGLIKDYLNSQSPEVSSVSIRRMKTVIGCTLGRDAWREALMLGLISKKLSSPENAWKKSGQSVVRLNGG